jgi:phosphoglycolate phosphatase
MVGLSLAEGMAHLLPGASPATHAAMVEAYKAAFMSLRQGEHAPEALFPGARAVLDDLAARDDLVIGIATGKSRRGVDLVLGLHDLAGRFATIQTADGHPSKPHPSMIHAALAETGVTPERAVMIGDATFDITMARAAGIFAIGVGWGYQSPDRLEAAGAHALVADYGAVIPAVSRLLEW